jgi:hypothetical protein
MRAAIEDEVVTIGCLLKRDRLFEQARDVRRESADRAQHVDTHRGMRMRGKTEQAECGELSTQQQSE